MGLPQVVAGKEWLKGKMTALIWGIHGKQRIPNVEVIHKNCRDGIQNDRIWRDC